MRGACLPCRGSSRGSARALVGLLDGASQPGDGGEGGTGWALLVLCAWLLPPSERRLHSSHWPEWSLQTTPSLEAQARGRQLFHEATRPPVGASGTFYEPGTVLSASINMHCLIWSSQPLYEALCSYFFLLIFHFFIQLHLCSWTQDNHVMIKFHLPHFVFI